MESPFDVAPKMLYGAGYYPIEPPIPTLVAPGMKAAKSLVGRVKERRREGGRGGQTAEWGMGEEKRDGGRWMDFHFEKATFSLPHPRLFRVCVCVCVRKNCGSGKGIYLLGLSVSLYFLIPPE